MSDKTKIEWTDATWNPITGCSLASPGCTNCYAMELAGTRLKNHPSRSGLTRVSGSRPKWTGEVRFNQQWIDQPMRWQKPRMIFVCAHGDLFHENVPDEWIDKVFAVMALCPQHVFQVLTKRADRMRDYMGEQSIGSRFVHDHVFDMASPGSESRRAALARLAGSPDRPMVLPNVWLGVSTEDQERANERIPYLLTTPAAVRWISAEPLLGPIDLSNVWPDHTASMNALEGGARHLLGVREHTPALDWVVVGGESGRSARPMHPQWVRRLRDQCHHARVPFLFKQWGEFAPLLKAAPVLEGRGISIAWPDGSIGDGSSDRNGGPGVHLYQASKRVAGRGLDGRQHHEFPETKHE